MPDSLKLIHPIVVRFASPEKGCAQGSVLDGFTEATLPGLGDSDLVRGFPNWNDQLTCPRGQDRIRVISGYRCLHDHRF
jgi:hypothetical protein